MKAAPRRGQTVGVCSIRRECLPNCLGAGYQGILATGRRDSGNGNRHGRLGRRRVCGLSRPASPSLPLVTISSEGVPSCVTCSSIAARFAEGASFDFGPMRGGPYAVHLHIRADRCLRLSFKSRAVPDRSAADLPLPLPGGPVRRRHRPAAQIPSLPPAVGGPGGVRDGLPADPGGRLLPGLRTHPLDPGRRTHRPRPAGAAAGRALWGGTLADAWDRRKVLLLTQVAMATAVGGLVANAALPHPGGVAPLRVHRGRCRIPGRGLAGPTGRTPHAGRGRRRDRGHRPADHASSSWPWWPARRWPACSSPPSDSARSTGSTWPPIAVALVAALLLPALVPDGGGTPMGLRSMAEGFRHLRDQKLLSATYWIDLNAMIFGMPRAVFPALGYRTVRRGAGVVGLLYAAPGAGALVGSLFTGWCSRVRHQGRAIAACVVVWGTTIALFGVIPVLVDRTGPAGPGRRGRRGLGRLPTGRPATHRPPAPAGTAVGDLLRGGRRGAHGWATPKPAWPPPSAGPSSRCGRADWPVWPGWPSCCGGCPQLWRDHGGGQSLPEEAETRAIGEVTTELGEGEPL